MSPTPGLRTRAGGATGEAAGDIGADELGARLSEALARLSRSARRASSARLTLGNLSALATIVDAGEIRAGELAAREGVAPATLSRVIAALEREGCIERRADPLDRRSVLLTATRRGTRELASVRKARAELLRERLGQLDPRRRDALRAALPALEALARDEQNAAG